MSTHATNPRWSVLVPPVAAVVVVATWHRHLGPFAVLLVALALVEAVKAAVHHAEIVALRVASPSAP